MMELFVRRICMFGLLVSRMMCWIFDGRGVEVIFLCSNCEEGVEGKLWVYFVMWWIGIGV